MKLLGYDPVYGKPAGAIAPCFSPGSYPVVPSGNLPILAGVERIDEQEREATNKLLAASAKKRADGHLSDDRSSSREFQDRK